MTEKTIVACDVCNSAGDKMRLEKATWFCVDCDENQCEECSRSHKRQKLFKAHQVIKIDEQMKKNLAKKQLSNDQKDIIKIIVCSVCAENNDDNEISEATLFCVDCCESQCIGCSKDHKRQRLFRTHKVVDIDSQLRDALIRIEEMTIKCDVCTADTESGSDCLALASCFCMECQENQCMECNRVHKRQPRCKNHEILVIDDKFKMSLLEQETTKNLKDLQIQCDVCIANVEDGDNSVAALATLHCIDCCENQCSSCNKDHKRQRLFRAHEVIELNSQLKEKLAKIKEMIIPCDLCTVNDDIGRQEMVAAIHYCVDCNENQCEECNWAHNRQIVCKGHQTIIIDERFKMKLHDQKEPIDYEKIEMCCDVCKANDGCGQEDINVPLATLHCVDCCENQCLTCNRQHKRQRVTKDHKTVELNGELKEKLVNMMRIPCDVCSVNSEEDSAIGSATQYCTNCREKQCDACSQEHRRQLFSKLHNIMPLNNNIRNGSPLAASNFVSANSKHDCNNRSAENINGSLSPDDTWRRGARTPEARQGIVTKMSPNNLDFGSNEQNFRKRHQQKPIWNKSSPLLQDKEYSKIQLLLEKPNIAEFDLENFWDCALPYIVQRIKMWNGDIITAQNLNSLIVRSKSQIELKNVKKKYPVSRLDCLTYIINAAEFIVAQDILRILSKFPVAIPLIVQDINDHTKHIVTIPLIQNSVIKWESTPGHIAENYLFSSPFRLIVAVRLGDNRTGKSAILNQLMRKQFMFSSSCETGNRYGQPRTLHGSVEIVWLTQETCNDITWKTVMNEYYKGNAEEVAILANFHGDVMAYEDTLKFLLQLSCSFIVFLMPGFSRRQWAELEKYLFGKMSSFVLIDPDETSFDLSLNRIRTAALSSDDTQETMRNLLRESLGVNNCNARIPVFKLSSQFEKSLRYPDFVICENSEKVVEIVRRNGCFRVRQLLGSVTFDEQEYWDPDVKRLIMLFTAILRSSEKSVKQSLNCLETFFSQLSGKESMTIRVKIREANERVRRIVKTPMKSHPDGHPGESKQDIELRKAHEKLNALMEKAENINLGQEHFFRIMGQLYEKSLNHGYLKATFNTNDLPGCFANILINGHAIELFNGDSGEMQIVWMKAICDSVSQKVPNFRVFVISIIGLQSSGKSTLLNALFSCRFAVSVGRCSRGLFMRMIWLDDELQKTCGCNCIILIDTEGLSSPERLNDPKASQKDRLMATYAMGVSNLTIVNILGEGMTEMTEILQIAIVAMARLRDGGIKPDILMVQHLQERNVARIDQAKTQFCEAINKAFELINKNDIEIGSASAECLSELTARIQSGDLFQHFGPFKDGSSVNSPPSESYHEDIVNLFKTLLRRIAASEKKRTFERWSHHFETYWNCVLEESFALNFKNVKHITDYLYFQKKIAKVKELLERAIRRHRDLLSMQTKEEIGSCIEGKRKEHAQALNRKMSDLIEEQLQLIPHSCSTNCEACKDFKIHYEALLQEISDTEWEESTKQSLKVYSDRLLDIARKVLKQTFDGSFIRQGCLSEFSDLIAKELKEALDKRPSGMYSISEQNEIRDRIFEFLTAIAQSKETGPNLDTKFKQALHREYAVTGVLPNILRDFNVEILSEHLFSANAVRPTKLIKRVLKYIGNFGQLNKEHQESLSIVVNNLLATIFQSRGDDYLRTGLDFEEGMVAQIRTLFPIEAKNFEKRYSVQLQDNFKILLQIYVLQQFRKKMEILQTMFNRQNKPIEILIEKKDDYISEIETRLKSGFSCAGEGEVVARKLYKSLQKTAIQTVCAENVKAVKSLEWTTNSEKVRLTYFEQIALEVKSGDKERAMTHFSNPKQAIENWYRDKVNSILSQQELKTIYLDDITAEFTTVQSKVLKSTTNKDIDNILQEHIRNIEDQYYSKLDPKDNDFEAFRISLGRHLKLHFDAEKGKTIQFPLVSDDPVVSKRLGCTEHCYWCGALCWGAKDHLVDKDSNTEMECHHSCHQPAGLISTHYRQSKKLSAISCHNKSDNTRVSFKEFQDGNDILWGDAKRDHFPDWKFDAHCTTTFDELMRWFFQSLHVDIATKCELSPADDFELHKAKCVDLNLDDILKVVRSKI